jgi:hypothetical protein
MISAALAAVSLTGAILAIKTARHYRLQGKVVLITGGSRGLGLVLAREFLQQKAFSPAIGGLPHPRAH